MSWIDAPWNGRRVLVTGHTGFKGAWLAAKLTRLGATVFGLALEPESSPNLFTLARIAERVESHFGDIRDLEKTAELIERLRPQTIFHLAAQPLVRRGYAEPLSTYATNVMGTAHVLDAARRVDELEAIVVVTSDKVYADAPVPGGYDESSTLGGADPYAGSKAAAELLVDTYRRSYFSTSGAALATARAGNVIGGGDYAADRLIPDFVRAIEAHRTLVLRNPGAIRPWQHVLDPLEGYIMLAEALRHDRAFARAWNFGPSEPGMTVADVVSVFAAAFGQARPAYTIEPSSEHETHRLEIDSTAARTRLQWSPRFSTDQAIRRSAAWYAAQSSGADAFALVESDIEAHEAAAR